MCVHQYKYRKWKANLRKIRKETPSTLLRYLLEKMTCCFTGFEARWPCAVTVAKSETLRYAPLPLPFSGFLWRYVILGCHNSTSKHSPSEAAIPLPSTCRQNRQRFLCSFSHSLTYSKDEQTTWFTAFFFVIYAFPEHFSNCTLYVLQAPTSAANLLGVHLL